MAVTPNLGLHQWQPGDSFLRTDFNADFSKIDTAVGGQLKIATGSFTANGTNSLTVTIGLKPKVLILLGRIKTSNGNNFAWGLVTTDVFFYDYGTFNGLITDGRFVCLTSSGFQITSQDYFNYAAGDVGYYIALY